MKNKDNSQSVISGTSHGFSAKSSANSPVNNADGDINKKNKRRQFVQRGSAITLSALAVPVITPTVVVNLGSWVKPVINSIITPVHAQTSVLGSLCQDGNSTWLLTNYVESGVTFNNGSPQSQVSITISGTSISMVTDWFVINSNTSAVTRGRVADQGVINLSTGAVTTTAVGSPQASPTHGAVLNLANNLAQSFTVNCSASSGFTVTADSGIYRFSLSRIA